MKKTLLALKKSPHAYTDVLIALLIAGVFALIALWRLNTPAYPVYDETYYALTALEYLKGLPLTEWTHPPLSKLLMSLPSLWMHIGVDPSHPVWTGKALLALRLPSVVFGALGILLTYTLARRISGDRMVAIFASILLAADGVFFVHSRMAMTNIFEVVFILLAALGAWTYRKEGKNYGLLLVGLGLGCAISTRWSSLVAWGLIAAYLIPHVLHKGRKKSLFPLGLSMILLPAIIYAGVYLASAAIGLQDFRTLLSLEWQQGFWQGILALQGKMWHFHAHQALDTPFTSPWWSWPMMLLPPWYELSANQGQLHVIWAIGNALVWWVGIPALLAVTMRTPFITWMGVGMWIVWALQPRANLYMPYLLPSIPFACMAIAILLVEIGRKRHFRILSRSYMLLAVGWFAFFYPLLTGYPISQASYQQHLWLKKNWSIERRVQQFRHRHHLESEAAFQEWAAQVRKLPK